MARQSVERDKLQDFARTGFPNYRKVEVREQRERPSFWWFVLIAVASFGLWLWWQPISTSVDAPPTDGAAPVAVSLPPETPNALDSSRWRSEIAALEELLFSPPPLDRSGPMVSHATAIRDQLEAWASRLENTGGVREAALADELAVLAERTRRSDFNVRRLEDLRDAWLSVRAGQLSAASWWQTSRPEGQRTTELVVYREASNNLSRLVEDVVALGQGLADDETLDDAERQRRWQSALTQFGQDLKLLRKSLPQRPLAGTDSDIIQAISQLDAALEAGRRLQQSERGFARPFRQQAFDRVITQAYEAADAFASRL